MFRLIHNYLIGVMFLCIIISIFTVNNSKNNFCFAAEVLNNITKVSSLSDFDLQDNMKRWKAFNASLTYVSNNHQQENYYGKMVFFAGGRNSKIVMHDYLNENPELADWSGFGRLEFNIYNPADIPQRIILKIADIDGKFWQRNLYPAPQQITKVTINISELREIINVHQISQIDFFRWQPKNEVTVYMDGIRLHSTKEDETNGKAFDMSTNEKQSISGSHFLFSNSNNDVGFGIESSTEKIFLDPDKFKGSPSDAVEISLARNEYESMQLAVLSKKDLKNVSVEIGNFISGPSAIIARENIKCYVVGYVKTQKPDYPVSYVGWWPDPLEEKTSFRVDKNTVQPLWIEVYAPEGTPSGNYTGELTIKSDDAVLKTIKMKIKIWDFTLPKETHLKTAFDFYDNRLRRAYPRKKDETEVVYEERVSELISLYAVDMIKHRLMPIFNFLPDNPSFLRDIKYYLDNGLSTFAIGEYNGSSDNNWPKDPGKLHKLIGEYKEYAGILRRSGLIDRSYIYTYDEPRYGEPHVDEVTKMVHTADPDLKNMVAFHNPLNPEKYPRWGDDIDIWCIRNVVLDVNKIQLYKKRGKEIWTYVSGPEPPFPTLVIDYPALAYRIIPWMCWRYGITGYLYWCVDFWQDNPWENPMNTKWGQNGGGFLYYPGKNGPVTSIRLEVTRDGLEDYEYFYMLNEKIKQLELKGVPDDKRELLLEAKQLLKINDTLIKSMSDYTRNGDLISKSRKAVAKMIEELNNF